MDKETVIKALKLANAAEYEAKVCTWEHVSDNESSMAVMKLAGDILIADAIRESAHPLNPDSYFPHYQVGVDMGSGKDYGVSFLADLESNKRYLQLDEPYDTGYYWAIFPDGSSRLAEIEEADSVKEGVKYRVHLLDHSGETMETNGAKWVKISPQL